MPRVCDVKASESFAPVMLRYPLREDVCEHVVQFRGKKHDTITDDCEVFVVSDPVERDVQGEHYPQEHALRMVDYEARDAIDAICLRL